MKLLFCQDCGDIVAPGTVKDPLFCKCRRHAAFWVDPRAGILKLFDAATPASVIEQRRYPETPRAYVLGITNAFLMAPEQSMTPEVINAIIDSHDDYYLFKRQRSCIIRLRPGESSDTSWAAYLPGTEPAASNEQSPEPAR